MRNQVSSTPQRASERNPRPAARSEDPVEAGLQALRRLWKTHGDDRIARAMAEAAVRRTRTQAATRQSASALDEIESRLRNVRELPRERRQGEIEQIGNALKALKPQLAMAMESAPPVGKLPTAISPGRAPKPTPKSASASKSETQPRVKPVSPQAPVTVLPRVGSSVAKKLENLGVRVVEDLLTLSPRRHIDYSRTERIGAVLGFMAGSEVTIRGEVIDLQEIRGPGAPRVVVKLADGSGWIKVTWFNTYVAKQIAVGDEIAVSGTIDTGFGAPSFTSPEWERAGAPALSTGRLTPVYPLTQGIAQKTMRGLIRAALDATRGELEDYWPEIQAALPAERRDTVPDIVTALEQLHYPDSWADLERAQTRLAFDDLLLLQIGLVRRKRERKAQGGIPFVVDRPLLERFSATLPFRMTDAQRRALGEILRDLQSPHPMTRLLQGDVGSGKTVVAATAALLAVANDCQTAVMAPTEILAEQHFHNLRGLFSGLDEAERPRIALLTGSTRAAERRATLAAVAAGDVDVLVGTHALIQGTVDFHRLGLAVVDEQHRFGVRQRAELPDKADGAEPHTLAMTATPIPRTLNMVINGDLDVSVIAELPPGRVPIETRRYLNWEREMAYDLVREEVAQGHQVFVICPLVEESEAIEARAAVAEAERLQHDVFPELRIATLHGRMSGKEKDAIMTAFRDGEFDILVSTSVIEVGIDVPNATVMLIEGADRFGLSQLHQFRGRVGRGGARSYCLLLAEEGTPDSEQRLQIMVETTDGFVLAEKDLELRGPGDFIGTRQSGLPEMAWLDGSFDTRLLDHARETAESLLDANPDLTNAEYRVLKTRFDRFWARVAPDVPL